MPSAFPREDRDGAVKAEPSETGSRVNAKTPKAKSVKTRRTA
jgi:hypothetical protein